ncbi:uncharacterized protein LOC143913888 isoform X1 [Arctopsyche grandis]
MPMQHNPSIRYMTPVSFVVPGSQSSFNDPTKKNILITSLPITQDPTNKLMTPVFNKFPTHQTGPFQPMFNPTPQIIYQKINDSVNGNEPKYQNVMVFQPYSKPDSNNLMQDSGFQKKVPDNNANRLPGLKILSDIKLENPIANTLPMLSEVIDLTLHNVVQDKIKTEPNLLDSYSPTHFSNDSDRSYLSPAVTVETTLSTPSAMSSTCVNTFSVIKNIGNPNTYKSMTPAAESSNRLNFIIPEITLREKPVPSPKANSNSNSNSVEDSIEISSNFIMPDITLKEKAMPSTPPMINDECVANTANIVPDITLEEKSYDEPVNDVPSPQYECPKTATTEILTMLPIKRNIYTKKTKKILPLKSLKDRIKVANPSKQDASSTISSQQAAIDDRENFHPTNFMKDFDEMKLDKNAESPKPHTSQSELEVVNNNSNNSNVSDKDSQIFAELSSSSSHPIYSSDKNLENNLDNVPMTCDVGDARNFFPSIENMKNEIAEEPFSKLEAMRPGNVITFGNVAMPTPIVANLKDLSSFPDFPKSSTSEVESKTNENNKQILSLMDNSYINENSYSATFSNEKSFDTPENLQKVESHNRDEWNGVAQKEEFAFTNFMQYSQNLYEKIDDCLDEAGQANVLNKDYTELLCPPDNYTAHADKSSFFNSLGKEKCTMSAAEALNIQTDEQMPPRGELSEQESSGDMDAPWAGMYRDPSTFSDMVGSTSYNLLARETWPSDGSDAEMPPSPHESLLTEIYSENVTIVESVKLPEKKYKCGTCGMGFNCPKERRVHRTKEHSVMSTEKKTVKKKSVAPLKIKVEKSSEAEPVTPMLIDTGLMVTELEFASKADIKPVNTIEPEFVSCGDLNPKVESIKVESEKKKPDLVCATCKVEFPDNFHYTEHLKIHPLECLTCGKFFNRRPNLQLHIKRHFGIKDYKCSACDKRFITKQKMIEHYNIHTGKTPVKCSLCDLYFRRHSNMVQHRNRHHFQIKKKLRDYVCFCGEVFHSKKKLAWHKEIHDDRPKACLHCNEKFIHTASLTRHIRRTHNKYFVPDEKRKSENVECTECNNVYLKSSIEMHMKTHTGGKPHSCVICNKNFTTKWNLKLHKWTHANRSSKPFKCALCKGAFIRQADYVSHMNAHKSVRPYTCNYCGCQFIRKYNCQRHVKEHENEKKFVCDVPDCGKSFHRSYYLTEHLTVHSGVRPFSCNICGKASSTKSNHNKHIKIHHAREPVTTEG